MHRHLILLVELDVVDGALMQAVTCRDNRTVGFGDRLRARGIELVRPIEIQEAVALELHVAELRVHACAHVAHGPFDRLRLRRCRRIANSSPDVS